MQTAGPIPLERWYRSSVNGGRKWSPPVLISRRPAGAAEYTAQDGFLEIYGDYGEIAMTTNTGKTVGMWGEGFSYTGPRRGLVQHRRMTEPGVRRDPR